MLLMKVGTYAVASGEHRLSVTLDSTAFTSFFPDRAFVVRSGESPIDWFVLTGSSTFFARLRHRQVRFVDDAAAALGFDPTAAATRAGDLREAYRPRPPAVSEGEVRRQRADRAGPVTSRPTTSLSIRTSSPLCRPTDPLFVAETNPALARAGESGPDATGWDSFSSTQTDLTRKEGSYFRVRSKHASARRTRRRPRTRALVSSTSPPTGGIPNPPERLGWGNDGPPLRDFALVAIAQHAPTNAEPHAGSRLPRPDR